MRKEHLTQAVKERKSEIKNALQTVYNALNSGQQKKLLKDEKVKNLFAHYGVDVG